MKDYEKLYKLSQHIRQDLAWVADKDTEYKQYLINLLAKVRKLDLLIKELVVDQDAEMTSMAEEFEKINKLNIKLGELLSDKQ